MEQCKYWNRVLRLHLRIVNPSEVGHSGTFSKSLAQTIWLITMNQDSRKPNALLRVVQPLILFAVVGVLFMVWRRSFNAAKVIHILAVISWFAGLFYLPRLFVYHAMATETAVRDTLKVMEYKLFSYIMQPAAFITIAAGVWMVWLWNWALPPWLHWKLGLVVFLVFYHAICWRHLKAFAADRNHRSHVYYRWFNEVPTLILVIVVILVVVKPGV